MMHNRVTDTDETQVYNGKLKGSSNCFNSLVYLSKIYNLYIYWMYRMRSIDQRNQAMEDLNTNRWNLFSVGTILGTHYIINESSKSQ